MKKIFCFCLSVLVATSLLGSCSTDDGGDRTPVHIDKKHDTALLLVTFGSTWKDPHATYEAQMAAFQEVFPNTDIYLSFTSKTCINRWYAATGEEFVTPDLWLEAFGLHGYKQVYIQSLHIIPGEEYSLLEEFYVKNFKWDFAEQIEKGEMEVSLGEALLTNQESISAVAKVLVDNFAEQLQRGEAVAFMGHGNPEEKYYYANKSYEDIEAAMQSYGKSTYGNGNIFVGTVDYPSMLVGYVIGQLKANNCTTVSLHPLMSIAGDHANNDMSADEIPGVPLEEQSWKIQIAAAGITVAETQRKGLGDYHTINEVWINHLKTAIRASDGE